MNLARCLASPLMPEFVEDLRLYLSATFVETSLVALYL
jgi:hypothetical protein